MCVEKQRDKSSAPLLSSTKNPCRQEPDFILMDALCIQLHAKTDWDHSNYVKVGNGANSSEDSVLEQVRYMVHDT